MKNIVLVLVVAVLAVAGLPGARRALVAPASADTTDINPNGSSELSLLMREMQAHAAAAREKVMRGELPGAYPPAFEKIYTAQPTTASTKNEFFDTYADLYLMSVKNLARAGRADMKASYGNVVSACVACHSTHCPGPMVVIRKLAIEEGK